MSSAFYGFLILNFSNLKISIENQEKVQYKEEENIIPNF